MIYEGFPFFSAFIVHSLDTIDNIKGFRGVVKKQKEKQHFLKSFRL